MKKLLLTFLMSIMMLTSVMPVAAAQESLYDAQFNVSEALSTPGDVRDYIGGTDAGEPTDSPIANFILRILDFITTVVGSIAIILFIIAGFKFMTAQGNEQTLTEGKDIVRYAAVGLAIVFLSYVIVIFVQNLFNVEL